MPDMPVIMNGNSGKIDELHLQNFIFALFQPNYEGFKPGSDQWIIMTHCFATFIMQLPALQNAVGSLHTIVKKQVDCIWCGN